MPVSEVLAGAALGLALQVLHEAIKRAKDKSLTTKCILDRLDATIIRIRPLVVQVDKLSERVEHSPRKVIADLKNLLEKAVSLVETYAELRRRNLLKKSRCKRKIKELEASLRWMIDVDVQVNQWLDIKELMVKMSDMNTKLEEIMQKPTDFCCLKSNHNMSQNSNQNVIETINQSLEEDIENSSESSEPKIDIHIRCSSRKKAKEREIRFIVK